MYLSSIQLATRLVYNTTGPEDQQHTCNQNQRVQRFMHAYIYSSKVHTCKSRYVQYICVRIRRVEYIYIYRESIIYLYIYARTHARTQACGQAKLSYSTYTHLPLPSPPLPSPPSALNLTGSYMCFLAILEPRLLLHNQSSSLQASWKGGGRGWKGLLKLLCVPWGVYSDDIHLPIPLHFSFFFSSCSCPSLSFSLFLHALPSPLSHFHISLFFPSFFFFFFFPF